MNRAQMSDVIEYGYLPFKVREKWENVPAAAQLVIGVNNADIKGLVMKEMAREAALFTKAILAVSEMLELSEAVVHIPEDFELVSEEALKQAFINKIQLHRGPVDVRSYEGKAVIHHPETILRLYELSVREESAPKRWIFVNDEAFRVRTDITFEEILKDFDLSNMAGALYGGANGRFITADKFEQPIGVWGNGELIPVYQHECLIDKAKDTADLLYRHTCGKCTFCREGCYQIKMIFKDAVRGRCKADDYEQLAELSEAVRTQSVCSFGQCGLGLIDYLLEEKELLTAHMEKKNCRQNICFQEGLRYAVRGDTCTACGACKTVCPQNCIEGSQSFIHIINEFLCDNCGVCAKTCPSGAIIKIPDEAVIGPDKKTVTGRYLKETRRELWI